MSREGEGVLLLSSVEGESFLKQPIAKISPVIGAPPPHPINKFAMSIMTADYEGKCNSHKDIIQTVIKIFKQSDSESKDTSSCRGCLAQPLVLW